MADEQQPSHETIGVGEWTLPGDFSPSPGGRRNIPLLMLLQGELIGKKYLLTKQEIAVGRTPDCDITLADFEVSRRHAMFVYENIDKGQEPPRCSVTDLDSKNGTFVNGERVKTHVLRDKDIISIGSIVLGFYLKDEIEVKFDTQMYSMATVDSLTGVNNKHFFHRELQHELHRAKRSNSALSLVLLDLDHFKKVNDTYGHLAGDAVLRKIGEILLASVREYDICARFGGEEFSIVLPGAALPDAMIVAERLRVAVQAQNFTYEELVIRITISLGIAKLTPEMTAAEDIIRAADEALYRAKAGGRNRICARET